MTPEEIVKDLSVFYELKISECDENYYIKAIKKYAKDYAKQMCDKQKLECTKVGYAMDAPYQKELI